ncbi:MAG: diacylglycerol kinase family protein [Patescibacteria group bacterium]
MNNKGSILKSFGYALEGILFSVKNNQNFRIQIAITIVVILASLAFHINPFEMGILGVMMVLVLVCEMLNTAIEEVVNLIARDYKIEAKIAKDVGAGMVLLASIGSVIVGILVFIPYLIAILK